MAITKTPNVLMALNTGIAALTTPIYIGTPVSATTAQIATANIHFGRRAVTAFTTPPTFYIQGTSAVSPGPNDWTTLVGWSPQVGSSVANNPITTANASSGQKVIDMTTQTNLALSNLLYIDDGANGEWAYLTTLTGGTSIAVMENLINTHNTGIVVYNQSEHIAIPLDPSKSQYRLIVDSLANAVAFAGYVTLDLAG